MTSTISLEERKYDGMAYDIFSIDSVSKNSKKKKKSWGSFLFSHVDLGNLLETFPIFFYLKIIILTFYA